MLCFASAAAAFWPFKVDAMICFAPWLPSLAVWHSEDDPRIRILLPHMMICVVLRIPPHRRHPPRPRIPGPRTSSSDTDIIARSDYSRGSTDPATSTASAPPADSWTAVPRTTDDVITGSSQNTRNFVAPSLNIIKPASVADSIARLLVILPLHQAHMPGRRHRILFPVSHRIFHGIPRPRRSFPRIFPGIHPWICPIF